MQKMRKMQKTQKMKKLRKMQKTRKMKGGFDFTKSLGSLQSAASSGLGEVSKLGKKYGNKALAVGSELGTEALAVGKDAASSVKSAASSAKSATSAKLLELGSSVYAQGSAMFEEAKNKIANKIIEKLNPALEKGKGRLGQFLVSMGLKEDESNKAIEAISEGNMEALQENKGLQKLMNDLKNNPKEFTKNAAAVKEELPEAEAVEVSADAVLAEVVEEAEAEVDEKAEVEEGAEVEEEEDAEEEAEVEKLGGGMIKNTIDDLFVLVAFIFTFGPMDGVSKWSSYMSIVADPKKRAELGALSRRGGMRSGGGKRKKNKSVKSRKNRKSKKSKSAKKH